MPKTKAERAAQVKAWRERNRAAGLCVRCGKRPPLPERPVCQECSDRQHAQYLRNRHNTTAQKRKAAGLCVLCGERPPAEGTYQDKPRETCQTCADERTRKNNINGETSDNPNDDPENLITLCRYCHYGVTCLRQASPEGRQLAARLLLM